LSVSFRHPFGLASMASFGALTLLLACGGSHSNSSVTPSTPWPAAPTTVAYAAKYGTLLPAKVVSSSGVTSPENARAGEAITLTCTSESSPASIVLDYGKVVGGYPQFEVVSFTGSPTLNCTFSESSHYVDTGDQKPFVENSLEPSRNSNYSITSTGFRRNSLLQGGQRYQKLSLASVGSITLKSIALDATLAAPNSTAATAGYFSCSDSTLNDIWQAGAYTVEANRVDANKLPSPWTLTMAGALVGPSNPVYYQGMGLHDSDTTTQFDFKVVKGGVSWIVNASFNSTVQFTLDASAGTLSASAGGSFNDTLRLSLPLHTPSLPANWASGGSDGWHTLKTTSTGGVLVVTLDGVTLEAGIDPGATINPVFGSFGLPYLTAGSSGIFNGMGDSAYVKNFSIAATETLGGVSNPVTYSAVMTDGDSAVLEDFGVGTNLLACLTDGAKRDRQIWSGDMLVIAPSLYYSSGDPEAIQGSLTLLSKYTDSEGQMASVMPPKAALDTTGRLGCPMNPWYSLDYSMYFVDVLHDYYLHTGDLSLVSRLWPAAVKELGYLESKKSEGLLVTDYATGWNWHPQFDMMLTGKVAEFNMDYVRTLRHASVLAASMGWAADSVSYATAADEVSAAINANLFNGTYYDMSDSRVASGYIAQDANSKAVLFGVAPDTSVTSIFTAMDSLETANNYGHQAFSQSYFDAKNSGVGVISPFISNIEVLARLEKGDTTKALTLIQETWGRMVSEGAFYSGATWESMNAATGYPNVADPSVSLNHAWASGPTAALSKHVLGVRPLTAGFQTWLVRPQLGSLSWASGRVPTPYGGITFKWATNQAGIPFMAELVVPAGTTGTLAVPVVSGAQVIRVNGSVVTPGASYSVGGVTYLPVSITASGTYTIEVKTR